MAKTKTSTYPYPKNISTDELKKYVRVTDDNKVKALVVGRVAYEIVKKDVKTYTIRRTLEYYPKLKKGHIQVESHPVYNNFDFWVFEDQSVAEHRQMLIDCFGKTMKEGNLYIKLSEPLMKYSFI